MSLTDAASTDTLSKERESAIKSMPIDDNTNNLMLGEKNMYPSRNTMPKLKVVETKTFV